MEVRGEEGPNPDQQVRSRDARHHYSRQQTPRNRRLREIPDPVTKTTTMLTALPTPKLGYIKEHKLEVQLNGKGVISETVRVGNN